MEILLGLALVSGYTALMNKLQTDDEGRMSIPGSRSSTRTSTRRIAK